MRLDTLNILMIAWLLLAGLSGYQCTGTSGNASKSVARSAQLTYICRGTEPFWLLKIDTTTITFLLASADQVIYPKPDATMSGDSIIYETIYDAGDYESRLRVAILKQTCSDGMSDYVYPHAVRVERDGEVFTGCAE